MTLKYLLSAIFLTARAADLGTTYLILTTFPLAAREANPLAAWPLERWGYPGMALLMLATSLIGISIMWYAYAKQPHAGRNGLIGICLISICIVAYNIGLFAFCCLAR